MFKKTCKQLLDEAKKRGISRFVVGAIIARGEAALLLKRKADEFLGGIYELPSGKVEKNESMEEALEREVREEVGLGISEVKSYLGHFDYLSKSGQKTRQFNFLVGVNKNKRLRPSLNSNEHVGFVWVTKKSSKDYDVTNSVKKILKIYWSGIYRT